jgi:FdhE protein
MSNKKKHDVQAGLLALRKKMPALENIFDAFGPLVVALEKADDLLVDWDGYVLPEAYAPRFEQGVPLMTEMDLPQFGAKYREVFMLMVDAIAEGLPAISAQVDDIRQVAEVADDFDNLAKFLWFEKEKQLHKLFDKWKVSGQILAFIGTLALKPFMVAMEPKAAAAIASMAWHKGYCPVCGTFPDLALLRKSGDDNAYLKSHGGQRWLHCSCCGHEWRFKRNTCPWCENEDHEKLRYLQAEERQNERVDVCDNCKHYFVTIDTRELTDQPDPRVAPLGLVHLDIKAQEENYRPIAEMPWNVL